MKREIKFRAWDGEEMGDTFSVQSNGDGVLYSGDIMPNWVLMQYTGLKDKNGKEIYEGDILQDNNYPEDAITESVVRWNTAIGGWDTENEFADDFYVLEVIGNIYENPELLQ